MPASATLSTIYAFRDQSGVLRRKLKLAITGLTPGAATETIAHGVLNGFGSAMAPVLVMFKPTSVNVFYEASAPDATNVHVGTGALAGTSCDLILDA